MTVALCKIYSGETGRKLADHFHEHLRDVEKDEKYVTKQVSRPLNFANHSTYNITICGLSLYKKTHEAVKIFFSTPLILIE